MTCAVVSEVTETSWRPAPAGESLDYASSARRSRIALSIAQRGTTCPEQEEHDGGVARRILPSASPRTATDGQGKRRSGAPNLPSYHHSSSILLSEKATTHD